MKTLVLNALYKIEAWLSYVFLDVSIDTPHPVMNKINDLILYVQGKG